MFNKYCHDNFKVSAAVSSYCLTLALAMVSGVNALLVQVATIDPGLACATQPAILRT